MTVRMDDRFAESLRSALVGYAESAPSRRRRARRRLVFGTLAGAALVVAAAAAAVAAGVLRLPGEPDVVPLAGSTTFTGAGTQNVELGPTPAGATQIEVRLACLTAGSFLTADGAELRCDASDAGTAVMGWHLPLAPGQHSTTITAGEGERWRLVATYSLVRDTAWGVNADGLTYGVEHERGTPDLIAAVASNGRLGYVYSRDLVLPVPTNLQTGGPTGPGRVIPVYTSDGHTVVGQMVIGGGVPVSAAP
jgi:hypothetical protein